MSDPHCACVACSRTLIFAMWCRAYNNNLAHDLPGLVLLYGKHVPLRYSAQSRGHTPSRIDTSQILQ